QPLQESGEPGASAPGGTSRQQPSVPPGADASGSPGFGNRLLFRQAHDLAAISGCQRRQEWVDLIRKELHGPVREEPIAAPGVRTPEMVGVTVVVVVRTVILRKILRAGDRWLPPR